MLTLEELNRRFNRIESLLNSIGLINPGGIAADSLSAINADMGTLTAGIIKMGTGTKDVDLTGFQLDSTEIVGQAVGVDQVYISVADGKLYGGGGCVVIDSGGIYTHNADVELGGYGFVAVPIVQFFRSRGTQSIPTAIQNGDDIAELDTYGYLGAAWYTPGILRFTVDAVPNTQIPARLSILLATATVAAAEKLRLDSSGHLSTYGYIYPGTGAAIQSTRYIYDTGTALALGAGGDLVGTTLSQTLTTKTLTSPTINGTIATTGLTMPAFTTGMITRAASAHFLAMSIDNGYMEIEAGNDNNGARIEMTGKSYAGDPGYILLFTPNTALTYASRLKIKGGADVVAANWTNCKQVFDATSLPNGDPGVSGQLYYTAADGIVRRSA